MARPFGFGLDARSWSFSRCLSLGALVLLSGAACQKGDSRSEATRAQRAGLTAEDGSTGVPLCDAYLDQYETCVIPTLPASQVQRHRTGIVRQRQAWASLADSASKRESLERICRSAIDTAHREFPTCEFSGG